MAIISKARSRKAKAPARAKALKTDTSQKTKYVMVTFGKANADVAEELKEMAESKGWSEAALAREMIRKCLGFTSHLP